ncbi:MAG: hypothetical protein K1X54_14345 [Flavobacteriales bacterium]|nr:hypothetical protein [Flavobacteriales bacterium]
MLTRRCAFILLTLSIGMSTLLHAQTVCDGTDTQPPVISASPSVGDGSCGYPQPDATALDSESGVTGWTVNMETVVESQGCSLFQPDLGANPCLYPQSSSMMLMSIPLAYRYYSLDSGIWAENDNGGAHLSAVVHSNNFPNGGFYIEVDFANEMTWSQWSSIPGRTYKADCEGTASQHENWLYYILSSGSLTGYGDFEGSYYELSHAPANMIYGYQVGLGANNYSPEFGSGGWFFASGELVHNGQSMFTNPSNGDFMFRHECLEPTTSLQYVYTATDACANATTFTQSIQTCGTTGPLLSNMPMEGTIMSPCELEAWEPAWMPNNCDGLFTYTTSYAMGNLQGSNDHLISVTIDAMACGVSRTYEFDVIVPAESELPCLETSCIADVNGDQFITTSDVIAVIGDFLTDNEITDLNQDGVVNIPDLIMVIASYGTMCD